MPTITAVLRLNDKPEKYKYRTYSLYTQRPSFVSQGHYEIDRVPFKLWLLLNEQSQLNRQVI